MVGNCAHCHNPRGFPSVKQPELKDVLVFLPGTGAHDGIFQFPLDTVSPVRKRGLLQDVPIPYVTPSLYDASRAEATSKFFCPDGPGGSGSCNFVNADPQWVLAPWRSLIYRNVETPYDYFDDDALFPHMPLNTSGYDPRVATLMADWMVSIPARLKDPTKYQSALPGPDGSFPPYADDSPQPYQEALTTDPDYQNTLVTATSRLQQYHSIGYRYGFCRNTYTADIIDPRIQAQADANQVVTPDLAVSYDPTDPTKIIMPEITPISPHYISYDDTDPPGDWFPRRPDWETGLVNPNIPAFIAAETLSDALQPDAALDLTNVMTALETVTISASDRAALTKQYPFGLWDTTMAGCDFSSVPKVSDFTGANQPAWLAFASPAPAPSAPVYMASAGAAIFTSVCFNCHGINADSKGLLADEITNLTGGDARVANLRDGLLGPLSAPGTARQAVFGPDAAKLGITTDDLTGRYIGWMTLGGTQKHLPQEVLAEVSASPVLGKVRSHISLLGTPDMLRLGLTLCEQIVSADPSETVVYPLTTFIHNGQMGWSLQSGLIDSNGDAEMWLRLCNLNNRQIVRAAVLQGGWTAAADAGNLQVNGTKLYWATDANGKDLYGQNPVLDHTGNVQMGVTPDNLFPICVPKPTDPTELQNATTALQAKPALGKSPVPFCPDGFLTTSNQLVVDDSTGQSISVDGRAWAARGAINAALAVFLYLNNIESNPSQRQPLYTQCNLLGTSP
jgi:mono/diheme cytochrome c family protein